ncbi:MAG TPA: MMPL family transporter [Candidatus Saccharimonadales bacterium]
MKKTQKTPPKWLRVLLPGVLIVVWLAFAAIGGPYFGKISDVSSTDLTTFLPESAEATKVNDQLSKFRDDSTIPALAVFDTDGTKLTESDTKAIDDVRQKLSDVEGVEGDVSPAIISEDEKAAFLVVPLQSDGDFKEIFPALREKLDSAGLSIDHKLTGPASLAHDLQGAFEGIDGTLLFVALGVVFLILLVVYRSPFLPFIVLTAAMSALAAGILAVYFLADAGVVELNGQVQGILFILVIGAATDYSLLYISRYREELTQHETSWAATKAALKASFEPILAAGGTVTVGLMCLLFSDLGSNKALGPVGGIGVVLSVLVALTFLPAVLLAFGRTAFWPRKPKLETGKTHYDYAHRHAMWAKVGVLVRKHPRRTWAGTLLFLILACLAVPQLKAEGVAQSNLILGYSEARDGQKILNDHFPSGSGSPTYVLADEGKTSEVITKIEENEGVDSVAITVSGAPSGSAPVGKAATKLENEILKQVTEKRDAQLAEIKQGIAAQMPGAPEMAIEQAYQAASASVPSAESIAKDAYPFKNATPKIADGKVLLQVTLKDAPDSIEAREDVVALREGVKTVDSNALVGGTSAIQYDTNQASLRDLYVVIPLILVAITVILMLLLRSLVAPIVLLLTTVLSFGATLGISALLFNNVWHFPGADPSVVIFGFVFLVALGIDYNIFLMTRVREETLRIGVSAGTIKGLVVTGGVITSAGIVLAATFAALGVIPIMFLAQIAFIVAFGVLLDTIIVRSLLVPAITLQLGRHMWWPLKVKK